MLYVCIVSVSNSIGLLVFFLRGSYIPADLPFNLSPYLGTYLSTYLLI